MEREGGRRTLSYADRLAIEVGLNRGDRIATIARTIGRTPSTVAKEVRRNWTDDPRGFLVVRTRNICSKRGECDRREVCRKGCLDACARCRRRLCNSHCPDFEAEPCPRHSTAPYACNACPERVGAGCLWPYRFYEAKYAHDLALMRRKSSREGIDCTREELEAALEAMREGLRRGQSPSHVIASTPGFPFSKSTFYRILGGGRASGMTKLDLPRAVRYRPRKRRSGEHSLPRELLAGRTYADFASLPERARENAVEADTVVGRQGRDAKCILTLYFRRLHFQLYMLLPSKETSEVARAFDELQELCGDLFPRLFGTVLADRGTEFYGAERIEHGRNGVKRCSLYFCDPQQSHQKAACEKNHVELRRILPKGRTDFDALTGRDMARCMSHVNSYRRKSIDWFAPVDMALAVLPRDLIDGLGIERIEPALVNLTPELVPHARA